MPGTSGSEPQTTSLSQEPTGPAPADSQIAPGTQPGAARVAVPPNTADVPLDAGPLSVPVFTPPLSDVPEIAAAQEIEGKPHGRALLAGAGAALNWGRVPCASSPPECHSVSHPPHPPHPRPWNAAALASGRAEEAAAQLARAAEDVATASAATALTTVSGNTQALAQAAVLAVQQGASAEDLARALGSASGGVVDPSLLRQGDVSALTAAVDQNVRDSVEVIVRTSSKSLNAASSAVATALAVAVEDVCKGGNATAAAAAAANATASATGGEEGRRGAVCCNVGAALHCTVRGRTALAASLLLNCPFPPPLARSHRHRRG